MIAKHLLRLDWHKEDGKENSADIDKCVDGKTYLDWFFEKCLL